ncbi:hypothetical protein [Mycolicibacterium fortuitum]|nr:hypothetical protein [Mycolicibacterium fortuitum]
MTRPILGAVVLGYIAGLVLVGVLGAAVMYGWPIVDSIVDRDTLHHF